MRTKIENNKSTVKSVARTWIMTPVIAASFLASTQPTLATIDNQATASGTYNAAPVTSPDSALIQIPVNAAVPSLSVAKSVATPATIANGPENSITDAGDTITYQYIVTNNGNVTISAVTPVDIGPVFGPANAVGTGAMSGFTLVSTTGTGIPGLGNTASLIPGQTATYTADYTLSAVDAYRAADQPSGDGASNSSTATGTPISGILGVVPPGLAEATIAAGPLLSVVKTFSFTSGSSPADVGDVITYTYAVTNNGNVPISNVVINDTHEGALLGQALFSEGVLVEGPLGIPASTDAAVDGSWDLLQPGASITFTYVHTVTQIEFNNQ
jgi:Domain of unknown function DUF11